MTAPLTDRLAALQSRVDAAARESGRSAGDVRILLATKTVPAERILPALTAGFTLIGENRVQEVTAKAAVLSAVPHTTYLIGHLQRNKIAAVLPYVDGIGSIDTAELAGRIDQRLAATGRQLDVMVQVNVSGEDTKYGVAPEAAAELVDQVAGLPHLRLRGLMTIGLNSDDERAVRAGYARLRDLRDTLLPGGELSMGMSGDFAAAIAEGATMVRLGSAVFGSRPPIS